MKEEKFDLVKLTMEPYVLKILNILDKPKRFNELVNYIKNRKTLSLKLPKLMKYGLIEYAPVKTDKGYANSYVISKKGRELVRKLNKL